MELRLLQGTYFSLLLFNAVFPTPVTSSQSANNMLIDGYPSFFTLYYNHILKTIIKSTYDT